MTLDPPYVRSSLVHDVQSLKKCIYQLKCIHVHTVSHCVLIPTWGLSCYHFGGSAEIEFGVASIASWFVVVCKWLLLVWGGLGLT